MVILVVVWTFFIWALFYLVESDWELYDESKSNSSVFRQLG